MRAMAADHMWPNPLRWPRMEEIFAMASTRLGGVKVALLHGKVHPLPLEHVVRLPLSLSSPP